MTFQVSSLISSNVINSTNRNGAGLRTSVSTSSSAPAVDTKEVQGTRSAGAALSASFATAAARTADSAASSILSLRKDQLTLAKRAETELDSGQRGEIETEIAAIQSEIETIASEAVDKSGNNVLSGQTIEITENDPVVLSDISSISEDPGVSLSTTESTEVAAATLQTAVESANSAANAAASTATKAEGILEDITSGQQEVRSSDATKVSSFDDASALSKLIAEELRTTVSESEASSIQSEALLARGAALLV